MEYAFLEKSKLDKFKNYIPEEIAANINEKSIYIIGAVDDKKVVGAAVIELDGKNAELLSIAVADAYRLKGIGSEIIDFIYTSLGKAKITELVAYIESEGEENYNGIEKFLWRSGFEIQDSQSGIVSFTIKQALTSPVIISALGKKTPDSIVRYKDAMGQMIRNFGNVLQKKELYSGLFNNQFIDESVFYVKAGEICGCILLTDEENGGITLEFAYVDANKVNNVILIEMIVIALQNISKRYSENTIIDVVTISDVSRKLTEKIVNIDNDITKISRGVMSIM